MASFAFYLDKPFQKGVDHRLVQRLIKEGKNYSKYLNPNDTGGLPVEKTARNVGKLCVPTVVPNCKRWSL